MLRSALSRYKNYLSMQCASKKFRMIHSPNIRLKSTNIQPKVLGSARLDVLHVDTIQKLPVVDRNSGFLYPQKPKEGIELGLGKYFSDHMLRVAWTKEGGWDAPKICPFQELLLHPGSKALHYAEQVFDGMRATRGIDNRIRMFRPMLNMTRMISSAKRACLPTFDGKELLECIRRLVVIDKEFVPKRDAGSLYIRPVIIATEPKLGMTAANSCELFVITSPSGKCYTGDLKLLAEEKFVRSWEGGTGHVKMASNYGPAIYPQIKAESMGCKTNLWLYGEDKEVTEAGTCNVFFVMKKNNSVIELVTPRLDTGLILPGTTRQSIIELTKDWKDVEINERKITLNEVLDAQKDGRLIEAFATGTAVTIEPIKELLYGDRVYALGTEMNDTSDIPLSRRILQSLKDIQEGVNEHDWATDIENMKAMTPEEKKQLQIYEESMNQFHTFLEPLRTDVPSI